MNDDDWDEIVDTTFSVANERFSRGEQYDLILARVLGVAGEYQVNKFINIIKEKPAN